MTIYVLRQFYKRVGKNANTWYIRGTRMIKRPENLLIDEVELVFNFQRFEALEIDLKHINHGKVGRRKSKFSKADVLLITIALLDNFFLEPSAIKKFETVHCAYFVLTGTYNDKKYKIVFCICSDRPKSIGIITLFRMRF